AAVSQSTSGCAPAPDGDAVAVLGAVPTRRSSDLNDSVTFPDLATGSHTVTLSGIASNCSVSGGTQRTVNVPAGGSTSASFSISCPTPPPPTDTSNEPTCTSGGSPDPDGYTVTVSG